MAGIILRRYRIDNNMEDTMYLTSLIHDESLVECTEELGDLAIKVVEDAMVLGGNKFCKKVKMEAKAVKTTWWYH